MSASTYDVEAARTFLRVSGRILERRLAEFWFADEGTDEDAAATAALAALEAYRNVDGGFGHGLESDVSAPGSQPLGADVAFQIYEDLVVHGRLPAERVRPAATRTLDYLQAVAAESGAKGGVPLVRPDIEDHPKAEHWGAWAYPAGLNPTAGIVGRARALGLTHPWIGEAAEFCWRLLAEPEAVGNGHDALNVLRFYETDPDRARAEPAYAELGARLGKGQGIALVQLRPDAGYGITSLQFAPTPDSPRRGFFPAGAVEEHLDALAAGQGNDGGWSITWEPSSAGNELAWRGVATLSALRTLRANGC